MAQITGYFVGPGVSGAVAYAAGAPVTIGLQGEWPRARVQVEVSPDGNAPWTPVWVDFGLRGASFRSYDGGPPSPPGKSKVYPPGAGWLRLNAIEFEAGHMQWTISNEP